MTDRREIVERVLRREPGRTALRVVDMPIQRATLDIIGRAYGPVVSSKHLIDQVSGW